MADTSHKQKMGYCGGYVFEVNCNFECAVKVLYK